MSDLLTTFGLMALGAAVAVLSRAVPWAYARLPYHPPPSPGQRWALRSPSHDPWEPKAPVIATILDVRAGWVRYRLGAGPSLQDERRPLTEFCAVYHRLDHDPDA